MKMKDDQVKKGHSKESKANKAAVRLENLDFEKGAQSDAEAGGYFAPKRRTFVDSLGCIRQSDITESRVGRSVGMLISVLKRKSIPWQFKLLRASLHRLK